MDELLLSILKWGLLSLSTLIVFSPFVYLGVRKWKHRKQVTVLHAGLAYVFSFMFLLGVEFGVEVFIKITNDWDIYASLSDVQTYMIFIVLFGWPLQTFYLTKLIRSTLTFLNGFVALLIASGIFAGLVTILVYALAYAFGSILSNHF